MHKIIFSGTFACAAPSVNSLRECHLAAGPYLSLIWTRILRQPMESSWLGDHSLKADKCPGDTEGVGSRIVPTWPLGIRI